MTTKVWASDRLAYVPRAVANGGCSDMSRCSVVTSPSGLTLGSFLFTFPDVLHSATPFFGSSEKKIDMQRLYGAHTCRHEGEENRWSAPRCHPTAYLYCPYVL